MSDETTLIPVQSLDVTVVFSDTGLEEILAEIKRRVDSHIPDVETDQGRKDIASLAYKVARSKTVIDNLGKDVIADWKKKTDNINGYRKRARDFLDNLKDEARKPLTDYENEQERIKAEEARKNDEKIKKRMYDMMQIGIASSLFEVGVMTDSEFDSYYSAKKDDYDVEQAIIAQEEAARKEKEESEAKERAAENERLKSERAAIDKIKAELKADQDKLEREKLEIAYQKKVEIAKKEAAERAAKEERDRIEREAKEKAEAEIKAKAEAERKAAIAPDREKLNIWASAILAVPSPELQTEAAREIFTIACEHIDLIIHGLEKEMEDL